MKSYSATLRYLYGLQHRGIKFGLRNIRHLLKSVNNPERRFASIHIAGTNGKGSTSAFLASIAMEAGHRTGLYTSPHLVRFTERIRIDGKEISEQRLVEYVRALRPSIEEVHATFFEATTCIAFQYFADERVDIAMIEAGLGGRLDSTNVLKPLASVITNIGMDHTDILGKTIRAIAREKGGIIKAGVPCLTASTDIRAVGVLRRIASRKNATFHRAQTIVRAAADRSDNRRISFSSRTFSIRKVRLGLTGTHQSANAQLALATLEVLNKQSRRKAFFRGIGKNTVRRGLTNVVRNTGLRGRLEAIGRGPRYILDVAHNPPGIRTLVEALLFLGYKNLAVVFGVMKDKDYPAMVDGLSTIASMVITVAPAGSRALNPRRLSAQVRRKGILTLSGGGVRYGLKEAAKYYTPGCPVLVTGSHYVVGEALGFLESKKT